MISVEQILLLFMSTFALVALTTPVMRKIAIKLSFVDRPNVHHKSHLEPVPYLGGVAIILGILLVIYAAIFTQENLQEYFWIATSLFGPALFLGIVGLIDDFKTLNAFPRFVAQSIAGIFTSLFVISTSSVGNPSGIALLDAFITILWIVGISNSINFFDNLDGGAAGAVAISSFGLFVITYSNDQTLVSSSALTICAATLGFFIWNKSPAKIYMGDAGALFLGTVLAVLTVRLDPDVEKVMASFSIPVLLLAVPILDTSVAIFTRIRRKKRIFEGGQDHLSHRLIRMGLTRPQAAIRLWLLSGIFVGVATTIAVFEVNEMMLTYAAAVFWLILFLYFTRLSDE